MKRTLHRLTLGIMIGVGVLALWSSTGWSEDRLKELKGLDYTKLGAYTSLPFTDFNCNKMSLGDGPFPNKKQWWESVHQSRLSGRAKPDILQVWFWDGYGEKDRGGGPLSKYIDRFDAWLAPEEGIPTYPEDLTAISLAEENSPYAGNNFDILNKLAEYIRGRYKIPVCQWYTDPLPPNPRQIADGWIFDAYFWHNPRFRKHLMKFVVLGKPVICMPWAADPESPGYGAGRWKTGEDLIRDTDAQIQTCMEFNVPVAIYAVAGKYGSVNTWLGEETLELVKVRKYIESKHAAMKAIPPGTLPLPTANFSAGVPILLTPDKGDGYADEFEDARFIDVADIRGFLDLLLTPEGTLALRGCKPDGGRAVLTYHFRADPPVEDVQVTARCTAPGFAEAHNELAFSLDGQQWEAVSQRSAERPTNLRLVGVNSDDGPQRVTQFWVRLTMGNRLRDRNQVANTCDRLKVRYHFVAAEEGS